MAGVRCLPGGRWVPQGQSIRLHSLGWKGNTMFHGNLLNRLIFRCGDDQVLEKTNEFQAHESYLLKCVVSPDVNTLATTSADNTVRLWNTTDWSPERTLAQHQRWVWDAVFSADSFYLVTVSSDQTGKLWDLRTGDVIRNYAGHNLAVTCVALNDSSN